MSETKDNVKCDIKTPKRVLYFSDGVLEEYDNDSEETNLNDSNAKHSEKEIILKDWPMTSVVVNTMVWFGSQALKVCDYLGENLANFFGITSPKYEYEIEEYNRRIEDQNRRESVLKQEFEGWTQSDGTHNKVIHFNDIKSVDHSNDSNSDNKKDSPEADPTK